MKILGIDTTFFSTCAAVVENGKRVLSSVVFKYKNLFPDKLFNLYPFHLEKIGLALKIALKKADVKPEELSLITVSNSGNFFFALTVGVVGANIVSKIYNIPVIGIDHREAHFFSNWLERDPKEFHYPILVLSASGAHSSTVLIESLFKLKKIKQLRAKVQKIKNISTCR